MDKTYFSHCKKFFHLVSIDKSYFTKCKTLVTLTVIVDILFLKVTYLLADCGWWMCGMFLGLMLDGNCSILTSGGQLLHDVEIHWSIRDVNISARITAAVACIYIWFCVN